MAQLDLVKKLVDTLEARNEQIVFVVSAFEGVTQKLIGAMDQLNKTNYSESDIDAAFDPVKKRHEEIIEKFFKDEHATQARNLYETAFSILRQSLMTHKKISKVLMPTKKSFQVRDQVIGFGERMAGAFLKAYLEQEGKDSDFLDNINADEDILKQGPITDRSLHEAKKKGIADAFKRADAFKTVKTADVLKIAKDTRSGVIKILGGHIGGTPRGLVPHQGRGYSDITAVDTALALEEIGLSVAETRFWKDVDGILTANPKDLDEKNQAVLHRDVSSDEALENASAGSSLVNVNALALARKHSLTLRIRNIQKLDPDIGTNIITGQVNTKYLFKTIVTNDNIDAITIILPEMADKDGFTAAITKIFAKYKINIDSIGIEGTSMTFGLPLPRDKADKEEYRERIRKAIDKLNIIEVKGEKFTDAKVEWDQESLGSISVIGKELQNRPGILGSISTTFGCFGINVYAVSHGKNQTRITYLINRSKCREATRLLHSIYVDGDLEIIAEMKGRRAVLDEELTGTFRS